MSVIFHSQSLAKILDESHKNGRLGLCFTGLTHFTASGWAKKADYSAVPFFIFNRNICSWTIKNSGTAVGSRCLADNTNASAQGFELKA